MTTNKSWADESLLAVATKKNSGAVIFTLDGIVTRFTIRANGEVWSDAGGGRKLLRKANPDRGADEVVAEWKEVREKQDQKHPAKAAFRKLFHKLVSFKKRAIVRYALAAISNDPDGFYTEACDACDGECGFDLDEACELCNLYEAALRDTQNRGS